MNEILGKSTEVFTQLQSFCNLQQLCSYLELRIKPRCLYFKYKDIDILKLYINIDEKLFIALCLKDIKMTAAILLLFY